MTFAPVDPGAMFAVMVQKVAEVAGVGIGVVLCAAMRALSSASRVVMRASRVVISVASEEVGTVVVVMTLVFIGEEVTGVVALTPGREMSFSSDGSGGSATGVTEVRLSAVIATG